MKKLVFIPIIILASCISGKDSSEKSKAEIIQAEKDFAQSAKEKGIADAFYAFADDSAVIKRGNRIIKGKNAIKEFYEKQPSSGELQWSPDFAEVSGDLGYTYGPFTFSEKDSTGKVNEFKGIFHTVWKKQKDGTWKFVFD
ncbi:MAG: nuclear transport factor 2 family protein [Bacteroidetes bacterium]|nr:nuclear transport factor 2 family protein [Bacteroidota bacterium]MBI3482173.1 nuclear transport factor 2 family protein [Bacteroidota bacterium]